MKKKSNLGKRCVLESYRETVVDIFGAGFCHAGISQVYLIKYDRLERYKQRVSGKPGQAYSKHHSPYPSLQAQVPWKLNIWSFHHVKLMQPPAYLPLPKSMDHK